MAKSTSKTTTAGDIEILRHKKPGTRWARVEIVRVVHTTSTLRFIDDSKVYIKGVGTT